MQLSSDFFQVQFDAEGERVSIDSYWSAMHLCILQFEYDSNKMCGTIL